MNLFSALLQTFKSWLREWLNSDLPPSIGREQPRTIEEAASALVERSRQGDQNAVAMICEIRDNAARGNERAKKTHEEIGDYIKKHPVHSEHGNDESDSLACDVIASFEGDEPYEEVVVKKVTPLAEKSVRKAIVTVANGPSLVKNYKDLIRSFCESLPEQEQKAFAYGALKTNLALHAMQEMPHECQHALILGYVLGKARQIQCVRLPECPISYQSIVAGEELD
jgi:hypothetical protein